MKNLNEVYEGKLLSNETFKANDGKDFKFQFVVSVIDLDSACGEKGFLITVDAAKLPKYLTIKHRKSVADTSCIDLKAISVLDVAEYGFSAPFGNWHVMNESDIQAKLDEIDNEIPVYGMMCGFFFDKQANQIGNNGWDFISGNIGFK